MTSERIKEIQEETAYPNSVSVHQALLKVWNECEQEKSVKEALYIRGWLQFEGNEKLFTEAANNNCLCKFDDGTICRYNDEQPIAILTHFRM